MNANSQTRKQSSTNKVKRTKPATSLTGALMPSCESYRQVNMLIINQDIPEFDTGAMVGALLLAIERAGSSLPDPEYLSILRVAACLKKRQSDELISDIQACAAVRKAMSTK